VRDPHPFGVLRYLPRCKAMRHIYISSLSLKHLGSSKATRGRERGPSKGFHEATTAFLHVTRNCWQMSLGFAPA
jgi:hypothetical protein